MNCQADKFERLSLFTESKLPLKLMIHLQNRVMDDKAANCMPKNNRIGGNRL